VKKKGLRNPSVQPFQETKSLFKVIKSMWMMSRNNPLRETKGLFKGAK